MNVSKARSRRPLAVLVSGVASSVETAFSDMNLTTPPVSRFFIGTESTACRTDTSERSAPAAYATKARRHASLWFRVTMERPLSDSRLARNAVTFSALKSPKVTVINGALRTLAT